MLKTMFYDICLVAIGIFIGQEYKQIPRVSMIVKAILEKFK